VQESQRENKNIDTFKIKFK